MAWILAASLLCLRFHASLTFEDLPTGTNSAASDAQFGRQMPPPHEPDAVLIDVPGKGGPPRRGPPGGTFPPGGPGVIGFPGFGHPMRPPFGRPGQVPGMGRRRPGATVPGPGAPAPFPGFFNAPGFFGIVPQYAMGGAVPPQDVLYGSPRGHEDRGGFGAQHVPRDPGAVSPSPGGLQPGSPRRPRRLHPDPREISFPNMPEAYPNHNGGFVPEIPAAIPNNRGFFPETPGAYPDNRGFFPETSGDFPDNREFLPERPRAYPGKRGLVPGPPAAFPDNRGFFPETPRAYPDNRKGLFPQIPRFHPGNRGFLPETPETYPGNRGGPFPGTPAFNPGNREGLFPEIPEVNPGNRGGPFPGAPEVNPGNRGRGFSPEVPDAYPGNRGFGPDIIPGSQFPGVSTDPVFPQDSGSHFPRRKYFRGEGREINDEPIYVGVEIYPLKARS